MGRLLSPTDDGPNAPGAVVLTNRFWTTSLHSDPSVIGKSVRLGSIEGGRTAVIVGSGTVGALSGGNRAHRQHRHQPPSVSATMVTGREHRMTEVSRGSLPAQVSTPRARSFAPFTPRCWPPIPRNTSPTITTRSMYPVHDQLNSRATTILWVLFAASALLFVIACSNVANLVLARTARRESELAVVPRWEPPPRRFAARYWRKASCCLEPEHWPGCSSPRPWSLCLAATPRVSRPAPMA